MLDSLFISHTSKQNHNSGRATNQDVLAKGPPSLLPSLVASFSPKIIVRDPVILSRETLDKDAKQGILQFKRLSQPDFFVRVELLRAKEDAYFAFPLGATLIPPPIIRRFSFNTFHIIPNVSRYFDCITERCDVNIAAVDEHAFYQSVVTLINFLKSRDTNESEIRYNRQVPFDASIPMSRRENDERRLTSDTVACAIWSLLPITG